MKCAVLLVLAACGRLGFDAVGELDAQPDAPPCTSTNAHDEDQDGIVDDCDVCPFRVDPQQLDKDGDRVGDACDPEIDKPRQRLVMFDPFTSIAAWEPISAVVPGADSVKLGGVGTQGSLRRNFVPATDSLVIGVRTGSSAQIGQHLVAILFKEVVDGPAFFCQLYDDLTASNASLLFTYTLDGASYMHPGSSAVDRLANGAGQLVYHVAPTTAQCATLWKTKDTSTMTVPRPTGIAAEVLALYAENVDAELEFFAQIRTDP